MQVIGYTRVSTDEQADKGLSLGAQRAKIEAYCQLYDLELVAVIEDAGLSGKTLKREGLQRAECALPLSELLLIGKLTDVEERAAVIRKLSLGAAKSVRAARTAYRAEIGAMPPPVLSDKDAKLQALITAWGRAGAKMQRAFVETFRADLERLLAVTEGAE